MLYKKYRIIQDTKFERRYKTYEEFSGCLWCNRKWGSYSKYYNNTLIYKTKSTDKTHKLLQQSHPALCQYLPSKILMRLCWLRKQQ